MYCTNTAEHWVALAVISVNISPIFTAAAVTTYTIFQLVQLGRLSDIPKQPISRQEIFIYGSRDIKSHLERQEMDRILSSGRLCNACHIVQVANIKHVSAHA